MAAPNSPGWYPAPDGNGDQWWNGAGWSESRRNADGTTPGLPGYEAAPPAVPLPPPAAPAAPVPLGAPNPYAQPAAGTPTARKTATNPAIVGVILGVVSLAAFPPIGIASIVLGILELRKPATTMRGMAIASIALGAAGLLFGVIGLGGIIASFLAFD